MKNVAANLHILIIIYALYLNYSDFDNYQLNEVQIKTDIETSKTELDSLEKDLKKAEEYQENLSAYKSRAEAVLAQIDEVQRQLPDKIDDTEILDYLSAEATSINMKNVFLSPLETKPKHFALARRYNLKGVGSFLQGLVFLERVDLNDRFFDIEYLKMTPQVSTKKSRFQLLNMEIVLATYQYVSSTTEMSDQNMGMEQ